MAQVFACQPTRSVGFEDIERKWQVARFILPTPFFLKVENGLLTKESAAAATRTPFAPGFTCTRNTTMARANSTGLIKVLTCNDVSNFLSWSPETGSGTVVATYGGFQEESASASRDSVVVIMFTCQKM